MTKTRKENSPNGKNVSEGEKQNHRGRMPAAIDCESSRRGKVSRNSGGRSGKEKRVQSYKPQGANKRTKGGKG